MTSRSRRKLAIETATDVPVPVHASRRTRDRPSPRRGSDAAPTNRAHAWLEAAGQDLVDGSDRPFDAFVRVVEALAAIPAGTPPEDRSTFPLPQSTAHLLAEHIARVLKGRHVSIMSLQEETGELQPVAVANTSLDSGQPWWPSHNGTRFEELFDPATVASLLHGEVVRLDLSHLRREAESQFSGDGALVAPISAGRQIFGLIGVIRRGRPSKFTRREVATARCIARLIALAVERSSSELDLAEARGHASMLRAANVRMVEFLSIAGHELKSPLTGIYSVAQTVRRRIPLALTDEATSIDRRAELLDVAQKMLGHMEAQVDRLVRLTNELLDVSQIQAGQLAMHAEAFDLVQIVRESVEGLSYAWSTRVVSFETSHESVVVHADPDRIGQVVFNYVTNALRYSTPDRPVHVSLHVEEASACVRVRDHGPGLTQEQQRHLWDRYQRVHGGVVYDDSHGSGGLGLGLYISRTIAEQNGGNAGVESSPGEGATFWFTVPLAHRP